MSLIRITRRFEFESGHALYGYDGKCKNIHGHSYKLWVTVKGTPINDASHPKNGMVIDFGDLKKVVKKYIVDLYDHATVFNQNSPHLELAELLQHQKMRVVLHDFQPTCENMVVYFSEVLKEQLPSYVELVSLKLQETSGASVEWLASDNPS